MTVPASAVFPAEHVEHLEAIDQWYWWHRVRWRAVRWAVARFTRQREFGCYFDVGSGGGGLAGLLASELTFGQVILFDQYAIGQDKLDRLGLPRLTQRVGELEPLAVEGLPSADLITCLDVLEHLDDPAKLLRRLRPRDARRAWVVITVPAMGSLWSHWDESAGHRRRYDRAGLERLVREGGWDLAHCRYLFHAGVLPVWVRRRMLRAKDALAFPPVPRWLNWLIERVFWIEFITAGWLCLPFGTSLLAVAECSGPQKDSTA